MGGRRRGPADGTASPPVLRWDGCTWSAVAVPDVPADLHGVAAYGLGGLLAVGEQQGAATPAFTMRWDGRAWHPEPASGDPAGQGASLFALAAIPRPRPGGSTAWAVGSTLPQFAPPWRPIVRGYVGRGAGRDDRLREPRQLIESERLFAARPTR